jgi:hypothetical protein
MDAKWISETGIKLCIISKLPWQAKSFCEKMNEKNTLKHLAQIITDVDVNLELITDWLATLALSQTKPVSKLLYKAMLKIQKASLVESAKVSLLNLFFRTIQQLCQQFTKDYSFQNLSNYPNNAHTALYLNCLQLKYARLNFSVLQQPKKKLAPEDKLLLIHRAMSQLGILLLRSAQLYGSPPKGTWLLLHGLYLYAAEQQLLQKPVMEVSIQGITHTSVVQLYKRILLFALVGTEQLQQQDMEKIYALASEWGAWLHIQAEATLQPYKLCFNADMPPFYAAIQHGNLAKTYYLQLSELVQNLQNLLKDESAAAIKTKQGLASHILEYLSTRWQQRPQRKFSRVPSDDKIEVCLGLAAVHFYVNNQHDLVKGILESELKQVKAKHNEGLAFATTQPNSYFNLGELNNMPIGADPWQHLQYNQADSLEQTSFHLGYPTYPWQLTNTSAQGYGLVIKDDIPELLQINKIIGLKTHAGWYIGAIRWLNRDVRQKHFWAGVELLAPSAKGVALQSIKQEQQFHGLLLPELPMLKQASLFLTPALIYKAGDTLEIQEQSRHYKVKLRGLLTQNHSYACFNYEVLA